MAFLGIALMVSLFPSFANTQRTSTVSSSVSWLPNCTVFEQSTGLFPPGDARIDCGWLEVPLNHANRSQGNVILAVVRQNASRTPRLGTIFTNPGGPGGSGVAFVLHRGDSLLNMTGGHFDIVSWDPRGVGLTSLVVNCTDSDEWPQYVGNNTILLNDGPEAYGNFTNSAGSDPDELTFLSMENDTDSRLAAIGNLCLTKNGNNLKYVGTVATARDMVTLANAVEGAGKLINYWGFSYGTVIGSYFVNIFPDRVGKVVLDGVVNPSLWADSAPHLQWPYELRDAPSVLDEFARACAQAGGKCAIAQSNSTQSSILAWVQETMDLAFIRYNISGPPSASEVSSAAFREDLLGGLYEPSVWTDFASQLASLRTEIEQGPAKRKSTGKYDTFASNFLPKSASVWPYRPSRRSSSVRHLSSAHTLQKRAPNSAGYDISSVAIACGDAVDAGNTTTHDVFNQMILAASTVSQIFGPYWIPPFWCHRWPVRAAERYRGPWNTKLAKPILLTSNLHDPITPLIGAEYVADALGKSAVLLRRDGFGHASLAENSTCTNAVLTSYFMHGTYPSHGTICATDKNYFQLPTLSDASSASSIIRNNLLNPTSRMPPPSRKKNLQN